VWGVYGQARKGCGEDVGRRSRSVKGGCGYALRGRGEDVGGHMYRVLVPDKQTIGWKARRGRRCLMSPS